MKTIELPDEQIEALRQLGKARNVSPDELAQEAIGAYLKGQQRRSIKDHPSFGAWKDHGIDGLAYQRKIRDEWDHRDAKESE